jgi:hypothetical protein
METRMSAGQDTRRGGDVWAWRPFHFRYHP